MLYLFSVDGTFRKKKNVENSKQFFLKLSVHTVEENSVLPNSKLDSNPFFTDKRTMFL